MRYLLSILVLLAGFYAGVGAGEVPGVTKDRILVGMTADLTGPVAFIGQQISAGARLYLKHVNEQGGVHGRQIELRVEDDGYQPPRAVAAFRKLLDRDGVFCFVGNLGTATTMATMQLIERERVPVVMPATMSSLMSTPARRYVFGVDPTYPTQAWLIVKYLVEVEKAADARLAVMYQDDDAGQDGLTGLREAADYYGLPIVAEESYRRGAVDFSTQTLNMKRANPTHVVLLTVYREAAAVMKEAKQSGWSPQFLGWAPSAEGKVVELAGDAAEGFLGIGVFDLEGDGAPMRLYRDLLSRSASGEKTGFYHAFGFGIAQVLVEGLHRSGRGLTREKLVEALETLDKWDGSVMPPVTYGPNLHGGAFGSAFMNKADVENRRMVRDSDWLHFQRPEHVARQGNE